MNEYVPLNPLKCPVKSHHHRRRPNPEPAQQFPPPLERIESFSLSPLSQWMESQLSVSDVRMFRAIRNEIRCVTVGSRIKVKRKRKGEIKTRERERIEEILGLRLICQEKVTEAHGAWLYRLRAPVSYALYPMPSIQIFRPCIQFF